MRSNNMRKNQQKPTVTQEYPSSDPAESMAYLAEERLHEQPIKLEMQNEELRRALAVMEASRDRYADLYEFAPVSYLTIYAEGRIAEINLAGAKLLGLECNKLIHQYFAKFIADHDKDRWYRHFLSAIGEGGPECFELSLVRSDGAAIHTHLTCLRRAGDGVYPVLRVVLADITRLKQADSSLRIAATAFEIQEAVFIIDAGRKILKVNQAFTRITGYAEEEAIGRTPSHLLSPEHHEAGFYTGMWESIENTGAWAGEVYNRRKNGQINPKWLSITAMQRSDGQAATHYVAMLTDGAVQKIASGQIDHLAFHDPLTNLPNRRLLKDRLHQALASSFRSKRYGALLFIDLDNFNRLNDSLGRNIGDLLLQQVAQRLLSSVRVDDTVARFGGDEFVLMLENLCEDHEEAAGQAAIAGKKILAALNQSYQLAGQICRCTPSIGATLFGDRLTSGDELLKRVDTALYQAKQAGRNTLCFFDRVMQSALAARTALESDLRLALERNQFKLYFQMQITHDQQIIGAEVLLRWQHPARGLISARDFIPLAEKTGLIIPIGQWVLESACNQLKLWENNLHTRRLQLAVNVSASQFHQAEFIEQVRAVLKKTGIEPGRLKLEFTESIVLDDIDDAIAKAKALKTIGVCFTLDDFGVGNSSLAYITQLSIGQLKIDQSFVRNIGVKSSHGVIVQTIINMAHNLGINVITEGVETEDQRAFLEEHGCSLCQGYLFGKPVALNAFEESLRLHLRR